MPMTHEQRMALDEIQKWCAHEIVEIEHNMNLLLNTKIDGLARRLRCRVKDLRRDTIEKLMDEMKVDTRKAIRAVASEVVDRAEKAGLTTDDLVGFLK